MKLDGYIRVSKVGKREGASFISPEVQEEAIQRWADAHGHQIVKWHPEIDKSAGRGKKRPMFEDMLKRVTSGQSDGIVVWKLSRFGRDALDAGLAIRRIEDAGGCVESATEGTQTKLVRAVLLGIAEDELDRIRDGWANATIRAVERGLWVGRTPIGYRISVVGYTKRATRSTARSRNTPRKGRSSASCSRSPLPRGSRTQCATSRRTRLIDGGAPTRPGVS